MKPEAQRIAIAESAGWVMHSRSSWEYPKGFIHQNWGGQLACPDYLQDRNAMADAIATLPHHKHIEFGRNLHEIMGLTLIGYISDYPNEFKQIVTLLTAPLPLLAEAYLKTIDKWTP